MQTIDFIEGNNSGVGGGNYSLCLGKTTGWLYSFSGGGGSGEVQ